MRYVSINTFPNGSTGTVMRQVTEERRALGDECWCMWGRGRAAENDHEFNFGSKPELYLDALQTRLDGRAGFHSRASTKRLLKKLDEVNPDVVHLHNIHGYYINVKMLFSWLVEHSEVHVKWTLHDCWAFTGHCAYFTYAKCAQWRHHCAYSESCPQLRTYPKTFAGFSSCKWSFEEKRRIFTQLPAERMNIVTPSHWLEGLLKDSFLSKYPVEVRHNTIDTSIFKPTPSDFRERYGIRDKFTILGVASPWTERKGLRDFVNLAKDLDSKECAVVLVGLDKRQIKKLSKELIVLPGTGNALEHAEVHTTADVHVQPRIEELHGMTVVEVAACGTPPVIESIDLKPTIVELAKGGVVVMLERTDNPKQLAAIYNAADVFFNPTSEDNYPTVNLEAEASGTAVITYDTGGCEETIKHSDSAAVSHYGEALSIIKQRILDKEYSDE